jgi:hypothetical protein
VLSGKWRGPALSALWPAPRLQVQIGEFDAAADQIGGGSPHKVCVVFTIALRHRLQSINDPTRTANGMDEKSRHVNECNYVLKITAADPKSGQH